MTTTLEVLNRGDEGELVRYAQQLLAAAGSYSFYADHGSFDEDTYWGVRDFQERHHLDVDGVVGRDTWAALVRYTGPAAPTPAPEPEGSEVVMDFSDQPMDLRGLGRLATQDDAAAGRTIIRSVLYEDAAADAQLFADFFVQFEEKDWDPLSDMLEVGQDVALGIMEGNPYQFLRGVGGYFRVLYLDGKFAEYKGNARGFRSWFWSKVASGAAQALVGEPARAHTDQRLLEAACEAAWQRISRLSQADKQRVAAAALASGFFDFPQTQDEWARLYEVSHLSSGLNVLLCSWDPLNADPR